MTTKAILVVDMLRGFLEPASKLVETFDKNPVMHTHALYCGDTSRQIIFPMTKRLIQAQQNKELIYFLCDEHERNDKEFNVFPMHCVKHTKECEVIKELEPFVHCSGYDCIIKKNRYSGFYDTKLDNLLKEKNIHDLTIVGVCTDICVLHTVADARNRDYNVSVPIDCVSSFNPQMHSFAIEHMASVLGAQIIE